MSWHTSDGRVAGVFLWNCSAWSAWGPFCMSLGALVGSGVHQFVFGRHGLLTWLGPPPPSPSLAALRHLLAVRVGARALQVILHHFDACLCLHGASVTRKMRRVVWVCVFVCACSRVRARVCVVACARSVAWRLFVKWARMCTRAPSNKVALYE